MDGECIKQVFTLVSDNPIPTTTTLSLPTRSVKVCCDDLVMKALADTTSSDSFKNDFYGSHRWFSTAISGVTMKLKKYNENTGVWDTSATLSNNTYGTYYGFGSYVNSFNEKFVGYLINWKLVLTAFGEGSYRLDYEVVLAFGSTTATYSDFEFCLKQYTADRADGTVKLEFWLNGQVGNVSDDKKVKDYMNINWYNSVRLNGFFGYPETGREKEYVQYDTGQSLYVRSSQNPEYILKLKPLPAYVHNFLKIDFMDADKRLITDYNVNNADKFVQKEVNDVSDYSPDWKPLQSLLAGVELRFNQTYNNLRKFRC
jgi:hypothetical protein